MAASTFSGSFFIFISFEATLIGRCKCLVFLELEDKYCETFFQFAQRQTSYKQETMAGITTFLSMAYILVVNPIILSQSGMDKGAVFTATAISAIIGSLLIGLLANFPIGIAPSMGLNSFFTFSVCIGMGIPWQTTLTGVFIAGILFILLSLFKIREMIINIIPEDLKYAISGGLGFFVAFVGLKMQALLFQIKIQSCH